MKLGILFFCITCFYCLNNENLLLAEEMTNKDTMADEMAVLAENIYSLLLCGRSPDEIAVILADNKEHVNAIQKLAIRMADLQNKQYSKDNIINLVITNEEKEKYYANENFWLTMENCYFVLKIIVILVVVIVLWYFLHRILSYFFPSLDGQSPEKTGSPPSVQKPTESNPPVNNNLPHDTQAHETSNQSNQETITREGKTTSQPNQGLPGSNSPVDDNLPYNAQSHEMSNQSNQKAFTTDYLKPPIGEHRLNERLLKEVLKQKNDTERFLGIAQKDFRESFNRNDEFKNNTLNNMNAEHKIKMKGSGICTKGIAEQIEYARSIGLKPEKINTLDVNPILINHMNRNF